MIFTSDNWSGASEPVIAALAAAARKGGPAYGNDELTKRIEKRFAALFEHEVAVFLVASGTVANSLALSAYARPGGVVFCHNEAHILVDEAGAPAFFGGGLQVVGLPGEAGKLAPDTLADDEPSPEPVKGVALLEDTAALVRRHVVPTPAEADTAALWIGAAHAIDALQRMPMLLISSPMPKCGKSTASPVIGAIVPRPITVSNLTPVVFFRGWTGRGS